ncbi:MAG: STAS domain-containing protein [Candidatus Omnitrophota bacterium]|nr:STAS domain-containing protein [Candidatus Omnitrophota bacterium]
MKNIFKHNNGRLFEYIKEIKEISDLVIVRFKGAIDSATIPIIRENIKKYREKYLDKNILVDFKEVSHVDSATLAALLIILGEHEKHRTKLGIINISKLFESYLQVERLGTIICTYANEELAMKALAANRKNI